MASCYGCPPPAYVKDLTFKALEKYLIKSNNYKEIALFVMAVTRAFLPMFRTTTGLWR